MRCPAGNSIHLQISGMMWAAAAYRAINEARRFSTEENPTAAAAPMLAELLDQGYVASMILSIGKLTDAEPSNPDKAANWPGYPFRLAGPGRNCRPIFEAFPSGVTRFSFAMNGTHSRS